MDLTPSRNRSKAFLSTIPQNMGKEGFRKCSINAWTLHPLGIDQSVFIYNSPKHGERRVQEMFHKCMDLTPSRNRSKAFLSTIPQNMGKEGFRKCSINAWTLHPLGIDQKRFYLQFPKTWRKEGFRKMFHKKQF